MQLIDLSLTGEMPADCVFAWTDARLRNRQRPEQGLFILETPRVVETALALGLQPVQLMMRRKFLQGAGKAILQRCGDIPVYTGDDEILGRIAGFKLQRSWVLCAMRRPEPLTVPDVMCGARRLAVLEGINEPSNLGAIMRSAAALGMDGLLLSPDCCDPMHRRAMRVSMGAALQLPWAFTGADEDLPLLKEKGFHLVGLALRHDSLILGDPRLAAHEKLAVIFGTEDSGLRPETIAACDDVARIPMQAGVDSLNVAACAAIVFWSLCGGKN